MVRGYISNITMGDIKRKCWSSTWSRILKLNQSSNLPDSLSEVEYQLILSFGSDAH